jgi:hypothetical protein
MKIGDRVFVRGYIDEIRKDTVIIRNAGGYFGTIPSEVIIGDLPSAQPEHTNSWCINNWCNNCKEIVRCEDCRNRGDDDCPMRFIEWVEYDDDGYIEHDDIIHDYTKDDGFCDRAERRTDGV